MSTPGGYRLLDETDELPSSRRKPPWSPVGIFFLTILFAPVGAFMSGVNWARLGKPEKRLPVWAAGAFALLFPIAVFVGALWLDITISRVSVRPFIAFFSIVVAYWQLFEQRPIFEAHITRGGKVGSTLTLWFCVLLIGLFFAGAIFTSRSFR